MLASACSYQPVAKVVTAFDRPCIPADCVATRSHTPGMLPHRALSGGRRNGLGARETFATDCYPLSLVTENNGNQRQYLELLTTLSNQYKPIHGDVFKALPPSRCGPPDLQLSDLACPAKADFLA